MGGFAQPPHQKSNGPPLRRRSLARSLEICPSYRESNKKNKEARARCPFIKSLLYLLRISGGRFSPSDRERSDDQKCLCCSQATYLQKREVCRVPAYVKFGMVNETLRATFHDTLQTARHVQSCGRPAYLLITSYVIFLMIIRYSLKAHQEIRR